MYHCNNATLLFGTFQQVPRQTQLFRKENVAIVLCYVLVGIFQGVTSGVLNVYPLELGATEAQQTTIKVLRSVPASFKIVYGFLSDAVPIYGYRRKVCRDLHFLIRMSLDYLKMAAFACAGLHGSRLVSCVRVHVCTGRFRHALDCVFELHDACLFAGLLVESTLFSLI